MAPGRQRRQARRAPPSSPSTAAPCALKCSRSFFSQSLIPEEQRQGLTASSTVVPVIDTLLAVRALPRFSPPSFHPAGLTSSRFTGLRQGPRQGPSPRLPHHRQGPLRLAPRRGQDQGQRRCRLDRRIIRFAAAERKGDVREGTMIPGFTVRWVRDQALPSPCAAPGAREDAA